MAALLEELEQDESLAAKIERTVLTIGECFVYKVPPLRTASGHRAEDWGLASPLFTGLLRVFQADIKLRVVVYSYRDPTTLLATPENLVQVGECPIEIKPQESITPFVDGVIDSSRYYVLRIKDPASSRTTLLGVGFREREVAFDFKQALNDYVRYVDRMAAAKAMHLQAENAPGHGPEASDGDNEEESRDRMPVQQLKDMTIKEGTKIKIALKGGGGGRKAKAEAEGLIQGQGQLPTKALGSFGSFGSLAPPPPPGSTVFSSTTTTSAATLDSGSTSGACTKQATEAQGQGQEQVDDEEWGSFDEAVIVSGPQA